MDQKIRPKVIRLLILCSLLALGYPVRNYLAIASGAYHQLIGDRKHAAYDFSRAANPALQFTLPMPEFLAGYLQDKAARLLCDEGMYREALGEYFYLKQFPEYKVAAIEKIVELEIQLNDLQNAQIFCKNWLDLDPKSSRAHHTVARLLEQSGRLDDAMDEYGRAIELGDTSAAFDKQRLVEKMRYVTIGEPLAGSSTLSTSQNYDELCQHALERSQRMELQEGLAEIERAIKMRPDLPDGYAVRLSIYGHSEFKHPQLAVRDYETLSRLIKVHPIKNVDKVNATLSVANYHRNGMFDCYGALSYADLNELDKALAVADLAVSRGRSKLAYQCRAYVYSRRGDKVRARADATAAAGCADTEVVDVFKALGGI